MSTTEPTSPAGTDGTIPFTTRDGVTLQVRHLSAHGTARGTILWIHGGCEHGGRYGHVTPLFQQAGWSVLLPDHRGHGLSGGVRTHVRHFDDYLHDLTDLQEAFCPSGRAEIWLGHSFGGLVALRLAQSTGCPHGLILSAPLLGLRLHVPWWKEFLGRLLVTIAPETRFRTNIDPRNMTRDPEFLARRYADPLLQRSVTARWFFEMRRALEVAGREVDKISCPLLALQGLDDHTVDPDSLQPYLDRTSSSDREVILLPGHVHEVLQESDWRQTTDLILQWLDQRFPRA